MDINKKLSHVEFLNREYNISHLDYNRENEFFNAVRDGNIEETRRLFTPLEIRGMGKLSTDPLRNLKYHLIITVALLTRSCIEGGLPMETAYNLSDIYIRRIDASKKKEDITALHREIVESFVHRMNSIARTNRYPKTVTLCLDYIYDNLHTPLSLEKLAGLTGLSAPYLSRLFKKEVGVPVSEYIITKRLEAAANMLRYSDASVLAISDYLCFNSESYFIQTFKKYNGCTPKVYRDRFFRIKNVKKDGGSKSES